MTNLKDVDLTTAADTLMAIRKQLLEETRQVLDESKRLVEISRSLIREVNALPQLGEGKPTTPVDTCADQLTADMISRSWSMIRSAKAHVEEHARIKEETQKAVRQSLELLAR